MTSQSFQFLEGAKIFSPRIKLVQGLLPTKHHLNHSRKRISHSHRLMPHRFPHAYKLHINGNQSRLFMSGCHKPIGMCIQQHPLISISLPSKHFRNQTEQRHSFSDVQQKPNKTSNKKRGEYIADYAIRPNSNLKLLVFISQFLRKVTRSALPLFSLSAEVIYANGWLRYLYIVFVSSCVDEWPEICISQQMACLCNH